MDRSAAGDDALDELFWQDEVLQAMYWLRGEALAEVVSCNELACILLADRRRLATQLSRLAAGGYLERLSGRPARYRLTAIGLLEGARSFRDEFADLTQRGQGQCAAGCACHGTMHVRGACAGRQRAGASGAA